MSKLYEKYLELKETFKDAVVVMRCGDFYEVFGEDAITVGNELDLTITGRDCGLPQRVPMIGFPFHKKDFYVSEMVAKGHKVAIWETMK